VFLNGNFHDALFAFLVVIFTFPLYSLEHSELVIEPLVSTAPRPSPTEFDFMKTRPGYYYSLVIGTSSRQSLDKVRVSADYLIFFFSSAPPS